MNKKYFVFIVCVVLIAGFFYVVLINRQQFSKSPAISTEPNPMDESKKESNFLEEAISLAHNATLSENELSSWKTYQSKYLGISFKYPPQFLVKEYKNGDGITGMLSGSIDLYPDTPSVRVTLEEKNPDSEALPLGIHFARSILYEQNPSFPEIVKLPFFQTETYSTTSILNYPATIAFHQGMDAEDVVFFIREKYIYEGSVQYSDPKFQNRLNFYKIISTIKFSE